MARTFGSTALEPGPAHRDGELKRECLVYNDSLNVRFELDRRRRGHPDIIDGLGGDVGDPCRRFTCRRRPSPDRHVRENMLRHPETEKE